MLPVCCVAAADQTVSEDIPSDADEAASFKRVAGGFFFWAPGPWPFTARHFLVTEDEEAEINDFLRATGWAPSRCRRRHSGQGKTGQQALAALVKSEIARWTPIIKAANIKGA